MASRLCLSVTFLDPAFHGRADGGEPEWPPSPLRLFQALVAACAARQGGDVGGGAGPALRWLEALRPPVIAAPPPHVGAPVRIAVPNNDMDAIAAAWAKGQEPKKQPSELKTMKTVRPTHLRGADAVHYLYELPEGDGAHVDTLCAAARSLTHLGWGVDMVAGHGRVIADGSADDPRRAAGCEVWEPADDPSAAGLRVPQAGTLDALVGRHRASLDRLAGGTLSPVPPLSAFGVAGYRRAGDPPARPFAAFDVWVPLRQLAGLVAGKSRYRPFEPTRWAVAVAGMVRSALARAAEASGWPQQRVNAFVHGHTPDGSAQATGEGADRRLAFLPLPSIECRGPSGEVVGTIRRVLVTAPPQDAAQIAWVRQALSGRELTNQQGDPVATLSPLPDGDATARRYVAAARGWSTVTPVVLPGRYTKGEGAEIEWREVGFRRGVEPAGRYRTAETQCRLPRCHVRVCWPAPVRGPLAVGAGRYRGLGLFAAED
jgi:CRISPR-associated protein Csb2